MSRIPQIRRVPRRIISGVSAVLSVLVVAILCGIVPSAAAQYGHPRRAAAPPRSQRYAQPQQPRPQPPPRPNQNQEPRPNQAPSQNPAQNAPAYTPAPRPGNPPAENRPPVGAQQPLVSPGHPGQMEQHLPRLDEQSPQPSPRAATAGT